jgi:sulfotransferase family protein
MALLVIGAGLPRTATRSLKEALETLLHGRCYHMQDVFENLDNVPIWRRALAGEPPDWNSFLTDYIAIVDWPGSAFWKELAEANPSALIVLSVRAQPRSWWRGANRTILPGARSYQPPDLLEWQQMFRQLLTTRLTPDWENEKAANDAYDRHVADVRACAPPERLLEWCATDGWEPLCRALAVPVPDVPFPHYAGVHPRVAPNPDSQAAA